jgi:hypothetical protein
VYETERITPSAVESNSSVRPRIVGIAPLVVPVAVLLPVLFAPVPLIAFTASVALLFNTAGVAGYIYLVVTLLRTFAG